MSFGFGFALPAYPLRGGTGNNPFNQLGPTLDLSFTGVVTDLTDPNGYTLNTNFIIPQYQIAAQYVVWETGVGLVDKTFSQIITFTRASTATYFDSAGVLTSAAIDAPRLDYNPSTLAAQGLLIEEARTNLLTYSEQFDNAYWTPSAATVTANSTTAPTNTSVADTLTEDTSTGQHTIGSSTIAWVGNTQYTATFFFKANGRTRVDILLGTSGNWVNGDPARNANFDLTAGTVAIVPVSPSTASIQAIGNGWFRCSITATTTAAPTASGVFIRLCDATGSSSYTGNGTSGVFLFGAQVEAGAFPTSYIPTTTTALTRSADVASVNTLSPWWNSAAGTFYAEFSVPQIGRAARLLAVDDGSITNMIDGTIGAANAVAIESIAAGVYGGFAGVANTITANTTQKSAFTFSTSASETACLNAGTIGTNNITLPSASLTRLLLGQQGNSAATLCGYLRRLTFYPRQLSNAELQAITT